ncbi:hypothetical protein ACFS2C_03440 [Prauserella oleivorans]|uniref:DUF2788 domain-containing protein n=1 Tax=Prauserella oleivorans TaxID=1478153 RepID=A0ABW5W5N9_9PSEU
MTTAGNDRERPRRKGLLTVAWLWVGLPFAYGVAELLRKLVQLFGG